MFGKVARIISSRFFWLFFLIGNTLFLLSNLSTMILTSRTPPQTVFPLYHNQNIYDQNVYLSVITLGQNGYVLNRDAFTSEKTNPGIFYLFYILVGKISGFFHLWPPVAYHLARIISVEFFFTALYILCFLILGKTLGFWASLFSLTATITPVSWFDKTIDYAKFSPWWMDMESLQRLNGLPHHIFGQAMLLLSIILIISFLRSQKLKIAILSAFSVLTQGIILPPSLFPLVLGFSLTAVYLFLSKIPKTIRLPSPKTFLGMLLILIFIFIPLLLSIWQTRQGYPWSAWISWEIAKWNWQEPNFNRDLFFSFSLLSVFSLLGAVQIILKRSWEKTFIIFWALTPFILLPFVDILHMGKIRLIFGAPFVPFGILSAITIFKVLTNKIQKIIACLFFLAVNLATCANFLSNDIQRVKNMQLYTNLFISQEIYQVVDYIGKNVPKDSVVLSNEHAGNLIPAYTPTISYFGHINQTMDFEQKQKNTLNFFIQKWDSVKAFEFLLQNNISYVYFGPTEKELGRDKLDYGFLEIVFQTKNITLFRVKH